MLLHKDKNNIYREISYSVAPNENSKVMEKYTFQEHIGFVIPSFYELCGTYYRRNSIDVVVEGSSEFEPTWNLELF